MQPSHTRLNRLLELLAHGPLPLSTLASRMGLDARELGKSIRKYEARGHVKRGPEVPAPNASGPRVVGTWERT